MQLVALLERDGGVGQLERLGDSLDDRRKHRLRRRDTFQPPAQLRDNHIWLIALPIRQPVHATLEPAAQGLEEDRDDPCGDERDQQIAFCTEERA